MKFYSVKVGRKPGVYTTWKECEENVKGFSGAIFKSFGTRDDALSFIEDKVPVISGNVAYTDGSFNGTECGCGVVAFIEGNELTFSFKSTDHDMVKMANVGAEIMAASYILLYCRDQKIKDIKIYHDYMGISAWALGHWKTNKEGTIKYKKIYDDVSQSVNVSFEHVKGHSGNQLNDEADKLASQAIN